MRFIITRNSKHSKEAKELAIREKPLKVVDWDKCNPFRNSRKSLYVAAQIVSNTCDHPKRHNCLGSWRSTSLLIDLQVVSAQGANQILIFLICGCSGSSRRVLLPHQQQIDYSFNSDLSTNEIGVVNILSAFVYRFEQSIGPERYSGRKSICLIPVLWIRPPVPPVGPQIICWSSHTLICHIFREKQNSGKLD